MHHGRKADGAAPGSANRLLIMTRYIFNLAQRWEIAAVTKNPTAGVPLFEENNKKERCLSKDEALRLYAAMQGSEAPMLRFIVPMLIMTGTGGISAWPVSIYADFLRLTGLMQEQGADLRLPHSRAMGKGLFELRCNGAEGKGRAFYCTMVGHEIVILHEYIKKTPQTPDEDLRIARKRLKEVRP